MLMYPDHLIKSPRYTRGDFIFLYRFVRRRRRRRLKILFHAITYEQLFRFLSFFDDCWPWPIDYLIRFLAILVVTLTLNIQDQIWNLLYLSQKWSDCHETRSKHIDWTLGLKCDHRVWPWPWPWPWRFKVIYGICYISAKNGAIATKRKANISIDVKASNVTIGFDIGHDLDLEFSRSNVEFAISLTKMVRLPRNEKQTYRLSPGTQIRFDPGHHLELEFSKSNMELAISQQKNGLIAKKRKAKYRLNSMPQMWPMGLTLTMTLTFEFSRSNAILTIWWPRSGVRIYQIGTGVTSDVGLPSTHLVRFWSRSVDFTNFGGILTQWNISNVWFPYLTENAWQLWPEIWHADVSWLPLELLRFGHGLLIFLILAGFWPSENKITHRKEGKQ